MKNLVCLISGNGTNLQCIIDNIEKKNINYKILAVYSNRKNAYGLIRAKNHKIPCHYFPYKKKEQSRMEYDISLAKHIKNNYNVDIIVCVGWMHILSNNFIINFQNIINLHPALPNTFPGSNAIEDAFEAFKKGKITYTGVMIHHVIPKIDSGNVIYDLKVPIYKNDSLNDLKNRVYFSEKVVLIKALKKMSGINLLRNGKVRDVYDIGNDLLLINHSNRLSSFDRNICDINNKGRLLCDTSKWWFTNQAIRDIVPNHYVSSDTNAMIVKKCDVIPLEFIVRGYITGSTSTSLWTHYNNGSRNYCGIEFPDGLRKNQKLSQNVLTPTTKGERDELISRQQILDEKILTEEEFNFIESAVMRLFEYGQSVASDRGLILVDTKYEFGRDSSGNIILIDEIHTADSSRYWLSSSYDERFNNEQEPEKYDKDVVRDYLKSIIDPYKDDIPEIPEEKKQAVLNAYLELYYKLTQTRDYTFSDTFELNTNDQIQVFLERHMPSVYASCLAVILSGSEKDSAHVNKLHKALASNNVYSESFVCSAHRQTQALLNLLEKFESSGKDIIYITVAGKSNALSGVVAANTNKLVIACPPFQNDIDKMLNLNSSIECPTNVPVALVLSPGNVALVCSRVFSMVN